MLFNSIQFAIFLPIVFLLYWFVFDRFISKSEHQLRLQNGGELCVLRLVGLAFFVAHSLYFVLLMG